MFRIGIMALGMITGMSFPGTDTADPTLYPVVGIVTEVDAEADVVYWSDGNNEWSFYGIEDWETGDGIAAIMSDNGTETVKDDLMDGSPRYWNPGLMEQN